jgi:hypothetical protein
LGLEQIAIGIERIELRIHTANVSRIRQLFPIFKGRNERFLLKSAFSHSLVSNQGVGYFGKGSLYRLLILSERTVSLGFR